MPIYYAFFLDFCLTEQDQLIHKEAHDRTIRDKVTLLFPSSHIDGVTRMSSLSTLKSIAFAHFQKEWQTRARMDAKLRSQRLFR